MTETGTPTPATGSRAAVTFIFIVVMLDVLAMGVGIPVWPALIKGFTGPDGTRHRVIDIPRFELAPEAQVALSGESGLGKTTFLHLIAGILKPDSGRIRLNGHRQDASLSHQHATDWHGGMIRRSHQFRKRENHGVK